MIAGGGVLYADATAALAGFAETHGIPVGETQAGKSALPWDHPLNLGSIGVTGSSAANARRRGRRRDRRARHPAAGLHHRILGAVPRARTRRFVAINVAPYDTHKHGALPLVADAPLALDELVAAARRPSGAGARRSA